MKKQNTKLLKAVLLQLGLLPLLLDASPAVAAQSLTAGLAKYVPFDGDLSNWGANPGNGSVFSGTARYVPGRFGQAASFTNNGANTAPSDWAASLGNLESLYANDFTLSLWVRTTSTVSAGIFGNKIWSSGSNVGWAVTTATNKNLNFNTKGGTRRDVNLNPPLSNGSWHLVTIVFSRAINQAISYVDGVAKSTVTIDATNGSSSLTPTSPFNTLVGSSGPGTYAGKADIDDLAIWSRALSAADVTQLYNLAQQGTSLAVQQTLEAVAPVLGVQEQSRRAVLSWTSSQVEIGTITYHIYRDNLKVAKTTQLTYTDLALIPATAYRYRVDAVGASGRPLGSNEVQTTTVANSAPSFLGLGGHYVVANNAATGTVIGEVKANDSDIDDSISYRLVSGDGFAVDASTGALSVAAPLNLADGVQRPITIEASDGVTTVQSQFTVIVSDAASLAHSGITRELWNSMGGSRVADLTSNGRYPNRFDSSQTLSRLASPVNAADSYGQRLRGYLRAPQSGSYTFWIASDDDSELRLASNTDPATLSAMPLATVTGYTSVNQWIKYPNQKSIAVNLVKGQVYYLQILHKEAGGGDHAEVAWQGPNMTAPTVISGADLLTFDALDSIPPQAPATLGLTKVDASGVTLAWSAASDTLGIANYLIYRDGALIGTLNNTTRTYTDAGITGTHNYTVVAVDSYGNRSTATPPNQVNAAQYMNAVEQALSSGNASNVIDPLALVDAALAEISLRQNNDLNFLNSLYPAGTSVAYTPGNSTQFPIPNADNERIVTILPGNKGNPLAIAGMVQNARVAAFGSNAPALFQAGKNTGYQEAFTRVLAWLLTGSASSTSSLAGTHRVSTSFNSSGNTKAIRNWLQAQSFGGQWSITDCNVATALDNCYANQELLIVGRSGNDADVPAIMTAIKAAIARGVPVLYLHDDWGSNLLSDTISSLLGFTLPYGGNYWANNTANWTDTSSLYSAATQAQGYPQLTRTLNHFKNRDWGIDLSTCSNNSCSVAALQSEFYAAARDTLQTRLKGMDSRGFALFADAGQRLNKLLVLLGDRFRQDIAYPMDKQRTNIDTFLRAYYADHVVYNNRAVNPAQPDLGNFSKPIPASVPLLSKTITPTTRLTDHFTAAGVYAVPGQAFTIERLDTNAQVVKVAINTLRSGSTHEFDAFDYTRPKFLQTTWIEVKPGQPLTLTNPHGGPVQVWLQGTATPVTVSLRFSNIGQHPVWDGAASTQAFKEGLAKGDYSWAEFLTPGFQIHSTRSKMLETLTDPIHTTPELLASTAWKYFYQSIFNLAGFTGQDLGLNAKVAAACTAKGWDCTDPKIHGMFGMWHFNADQAGCGYGCSGNPYDAYWAFSALGWGDAHEVGHGLQRNRLKIDGGASGEVSNNIFPTHTVYSWNQSNPSNLNQSGHHIVQADVFSLLNNAQLTADPVNTVHTALWVNGDVFWRLEFYRQIAWQSYYLPQLGDGGWDVFTLLYLQDRLFAKAIADDATWAVQKDKLGFGQYDRPTAAAINGNDFMLVAVSYLTGKDQRSFFDLWGVPYSAKAATQVASFAYTAAEKRFYVAPKTSSGKGWSSVDPINSVLVNGTNTLP